MYFCTWALEDQVHHRGIAPNRFGISRHRMLSHNNHPIAAVIPGWRCVDAFRRSSSEFATSRNTPLIAHPYFALHTSAIHPSCQDPCCTAGELLSLWNSLFSMCAVGVNPRPRMRRSVVNVRTDLFYFFCAHTCFYPDAPLPQIGMRIDHGPRHPRTWVCHPVGAWKMCCCT